ncbi:MAG: dihydrodipicolinate reductase [Bacteroidetes bacterium]|nr:dihydrodipicolinate reductase [Bacteroidota bacterium]MCY4233132.1 dihydrodipicolinate reductase [Bacteroidota bacterium]
MKGLQKKSPIRVVQYGLGPIGQGTAKLILEKQKSGQIQLVGAIDIDPKKVNQTVGELVNAESDVVISANAQQVLSHSYADVVVHTTSSFMPQVEEQLTQCIQSGVCVVSSTEELPYPFDRHPEIALRLDSLAKYYGVSILGTGVNPGYAMDVLALVATGVCSNVESIKITRRVDAGLRRLPLQKKVGAGMTVQEFQDRKAKGGFGHIGLVESLRLVMSGLGWPIEDYSEVLEPVICDETTETPYLTVKSGRVAGIKHTAEVLSGDQVVVSLDLRMYVGAKDPEDRVIVTGDPPINLVVEGGIFGDTATVAALVNAIPQVFQASPGLKTVADLPVPRCYLGKV